MTIFLRRPGFQISCFSCASDFDMQAYGTTLKLIVRIIYVLIASIAVIVIVRQVNPFSQGEISAQ